MFKMMTACAISTLLVLLLSKRNEEPMAEKRRFNIEEDYDYYRDFDKTEINTSDSTHHGTFLAAFICGGFFFLVVLAIFGA